MTEEMATITKARYDDLLESEDWLSCLERAGIDNSEAYEYALELRNESQED